MRILLLVGGFLCLLSHAFGQIRIRGNISSTAGQPLMGCVVLVSKADSSILAYTTTDEKGWYVLEMDPDTTHVLLTINNLGFISQSRWVSAESQSLDFVLEKEPVDLKPVLVKGDLLPIRVREDTTIFTVQKFADGSERVLEDILKKLPGIRVDENGGISFKGKPIEKILLEGDEFFSKNYHLLSKNLSAQLLGTIEAIENASDTPLLKGIERSDKTVLNVKLREDRHKVIFGTADVAAGLTQRYEARANVFSLINRLKLGVIGTANNTGRNPIPEVTYDLGKEESESSPVQDSNPSQLLIQKPGFIVPGLAAERFNQNRVGLGAANVTLTISPKVKMRAFTYRLGDRNPQQIINRYTYVLEQSPLIIQDTQQLETRPRLQVSQMALEYMPSTTTRWKWEGNWQTEQINSAFDITSSNPAFTEQLQQKMFSRQEGMQQQLGYIHRFPGRRALTVDAYFQQQNRPQELRIRSNRFNALFPENTGQITQSVANQRQVWALQSRWMGAWGDRRKYAFNANFSDLRESLSSRLLSQAQTIENADYRNELAYRKKHVSLEAQATLPWGKLEFFLGASVHLVQLQASGEETTFRYLNPIAGLTVRINQDTKLRAFYGHNQSQPSSTNLMNGYVLSSYRSFQRGYAGWNRLKTNYFALNFSNTDWLHQFSMHTNFTYASEKSPYVQRVGVNDQFTFNSLIPTPFPNDSYELATDLSKYISAFQLNTNARLSAGWNSYQSMINASTLNRGAVRSLQSKLVVRTAFDGMINLEAGYEVLWSDVRETGVSLGYNRLSKPIVALKMNPSKVWFFILTSEWTRLKTDAEQNQFYFLDGLVRFLPPNRKFSLELVGKNLLNSPNATYSQLTNYLISQSTYQLVPRYVMLRADFQF